MPPPHLSIVQGYTSGQKPPVASLRWTPSGGSQSCLSRGSIMSVFSAHVSTLEAVLSFPLCCVSMVIFLPSVRFPTVSLLNNFH